jgi:hypothetical protein
MPRVITHRYDPARGAFLNLCSLPDLQASRILDCLRRESRPTLKANYLARRRCTEEWLAQTASAVLGRVIRQQPAYFFLGDFSYLVDPSRPAALVIPLSILAPEAMTFTLGDSMSVVEEPGRRVYKLQEMAALFHQGEAVAGFGLSDKAGFETRFVEVQVWDRSQVLIPRP